MSRIHIFCEDTSHISTSISSIPSKSKTQQTNERKICFFFSLFFGSLRKFKALAEHLKNKRDDDGGGNKRWQRRWLLRWRKGTKRKKRKMCEFNSIRFCFGIGVASPSKLANTCRHTVIHSGLSLSLALEYSVLRSTFIPITDENRYFFFFGTFFLRCCCCRRSIIICETTGT